MSDKRNTHRFNPAWNKLESEAIEIEKSENHRIYRNQDGSMTAVFGCESNSHNNELVLDELTKQYHHKRNGFSTQFAKNLEENVFSIEREGHKLKFALLGSHAQEVREETNECCENNIGCAAHLSAEDHCKLCYHGFEKNSDLEYIVQDNGVKENIILHEKRKHYKFAFIAKTGDMEMLEQKDGSILIACREGVNHEQVVFRIPAPVMYDANGKISNAVCYKIKELHEEGTYLFVVTADSAWINANDRAFPVVIDPQVTFPHKNMNGIVTMEQHYAEIVIPPPPDAETPEEEDCGKNCSGCGCDSCGSSNCEKNGCNTTATENATGDMSGSGVAMFAMRNRMVSCPDSSECPPPYDGGSGSDSFSGECPPSSDSNGDSQECYPGIDNSESCGGNCDNNNCEPVDPPDTPTMPDTGLAIVPSGQYWVQNSGTDNYWVTLKLKNMVSLPPFNYQGTHFVRVVIGLKVSEWLGSTHFKIMYNDKCIEEMDYHGGTIYFDVTPFAREMWRDKTSYRNLTLRAEGGNYSYLRFSETNLATCYIDYITVDEAEQNSEVLDFNAGNAGEGSINLSTGKVTFAHHDVTADSALMPLSLSHVFTSNLKQKENISLIHNNKVVVATPAFAMGKGWKLNVQQSLVVPGRDVEYSEKLLSNDAETAYYFDAEGIRHIFEKKYYYLKNGVKHFVEESELEKENNTKIVDAEGNYCAIVDGVEEVVYGKLMDKNNLVLEIDKDKTLYLAKKNLKRYFLENGVKCYLEVLSNGKYRYTGHYVDYNGQAEVDSSFVYRDESYDKFTILSVQRIVFEKIYTVDLLRDAKGEYIIRNILGCDGKRVETRYDVISEVDEKALADFSAATLSDEMREAESALGSINGQLQEMLNNHDQYRIQLNELEYPNLHQKALEDAQLAYRDIAQEANTAINNNNILSIDSQKSIYQSTYDEYDSICRELKGKIELIEKFFASDHPLLEEDAKRAELSYLLEEKRKCDKELAHYETLIQEYNRNRTNISPHTISVQQKQYVVEEYTETVETLTKHTQIATLKRILGELDKSIDTLLLHRGEKLKDYEHLRDEEKKLPCDVLIDENGNKLAFDYYGRLVAVEDSSENAVAFVYDDLGRLEKIVTADERAMILQYNAKNRLDTLYDMAGRASKYCYDENGYLVEIRLPEYDAEHPHAKILFAYTENGNLASVCDASGYGQKLEYDAEKIKLTEHTNAEYVDESGVHKLMEPTDGEMTEITFISPLLTSVRNSRTTAFYQLEVSGKLAATYEKDNLKDILLSQSTIYREENKKITTQSDCSKKNLMPAFTAEDVRSLRYATFENGVVTVNGSLNRERRISKTVELHGDKQQYLLSLFAKADSAQFDTARVTGLDEDETAWDGGYSGNVARTFGIEAEVTYEDDTIETFYAFFDYFNSDWQLCQLPLRLKVAAKSIKATFCYDCNANSAQIKSFRLTEEHGVEETFTEDDRILSRLDKDFHIYYTYNDGVHAVEILQVRAEDALAFSCMQNCATCAGKNTCKHAVNKYGYDAKGRLLWCEDGNGIIIEHTYNEKGQITKTVTYHESDPANKLYAEHVYDEQGREIETPDPRGEVNGKLLASKTAFVDNTTIPQSVTAPNGAKTAYGYHHLTGLLTSMTSDDNGIEHTNRTKYMADKLVKVDNPAGMCYNYKYDGVGRLRNVSINGENHVAHNYTEGKDENGNLLSTTHTVTLPNNESFSKTADVWARTVDNTYQGDTYKQTTYDDYGRVIREIEYPGTTAKTHIYTYSDEEDTHTVGAWRESACKDEKGRVTEKTYAHNGIDVQKYGFTYEDTLDGKLASMLWNNALREEYKRDALGRLTGIITHNGTEKLHSRKISYLKYGDHATNLVAALTYTDKNGVNSTERYGYNEAGHIDTVTENGRIKARYTYDNLDRLVREDNKAWGKTFTFLYDNGGNILLKREYAYTLETEKFEDIEPVNEIAYGYADGNRPDQLTSFNGEVIAYNENGMPTTYRGNTCTYKRATLLAGYGSHTFDYDANGLRIKKNETVYTYIGGKLIREENSGHTIDYIYGNDGITGIKYNGTVYLFRKNVFGDVTHIYDIAGTLHARYIYDAWGNHTVVNDTENEIGTINPIRYRSYYYDTETKLYYLRARYYDPETGRFISQDNISYLDPEHLIGLNLYTYCNNNFINKCDFSGHIAITLTTLLVAGLVAGAIGGGVGFASAAYNDYKEDEVWFNGDWTDYAGKTVGGFVAGFGIGVCTILGAGVGAAALGGTTATLFTSTGVSLSIGSALGLGAGVSFTTGVAGYLLKASISRSEQFSIQNMFVEGAFNAMSGVLSVFGGALGGYAGFHNTVFTKLLSQKGDFLSRIFIENVFTVGCKIINAILKSSLLK